jgi:hypothetical protein
MYIEQKQDGKQQWSVYIIAQNNNSNKGCRSVSNRSHMEQNKKVSSSGMHIATKELAYR